MLCGSFLSNSTVRATHRPAFRRPIVTSFRVNLISSANVLRSTRPSAAGMRDDPAHTGLLRDVLGSISASSAGRCSCSAAEDIARTCAPETAQDRTHHRGARERVVQPDGRWYFSPGVDGLGRDVQPGKHMSSSPGESSTTRGPSGLAHELRLRRPLNLAGFSPGTQMRTASDTQGLEGTAGGCRGKGVRR
jgi:hypothetical protein